MAKSKRRLWRCPECRAGILAPGKLRKIDVRRYCLPCSEEAGVLVERKCKVNEEKAKEAKKKSAKKAAKKRAKISRRRRATKEAHKTFWLVDGLDLRKEFARICSYPHLRTGLARKGIVTDIFVQRDNCKTTYHGKVYGSSSTMKLWLKRGAVTRFQAVMIICHELAHIIDDDRAAIGGGWGHGESWWSHFKEIVYEAFGVSVNGAIEENRWSRDQAILEALKECEWLSEKKKPPRKPKRPKDRPKILMQLYPMRDSRYRDHKRMENVYI